MEESAKRFTAQKIKDTAQTFCQLIDEEIPCTGRFLKKHIGFEIPDTGFEGVLGIEEYGKEPLTMRCLSVGVYDNESGMMRFNYKFKGTNDEVMSFLRSKEGLKEIFRSVVHLYDRCVSNR